MRTMPVRDAIPTQCTISSACDRCAAQPSRCRGRGPPLTNRSCSGRPSLRRFARPSCWPLNSWSFAQRRGPRVRSLACNHRMDVAPDKSARLFRPGLSGRSGRSISTNQRRACAIDVSNVKGPDETIPEILATAWAERIGRHQLTDSERQKAPVKESPGKFRGRVIARTRGIPRIPRKRRPLLAASRGCRNPPLRWGELLPASQRPPCARGPSLVLRAYGKIAASTFEGIRRTRPDEL
jgi:hypothetical protein